MSSINQQTEVVLNDLWKLWQEESDAALLEYITENQLVENGWIKCSLNNDVQHSVLLEWLLKHCHGEFYLMKYNCLFVEVNDSTLYKLTWL